MRNATMLGACTALLMFPMQRVLSQTPDSITSARAEDVMARVRRLTTNDVASARQLADSLVRVLPSTAAAMPAALFAKASIAPSAADAERGYERIVNDYRFAPQVPDALMRLALLESARNNRTGALRHLDRLLRDHSDAPVRSRASLMAGRMRMDANDPARACELLAAAYASAGPTERDVREQAATVGATCPTPVPIMAERDPPPMGVVRAAREVAVPSVVAPVSVPSSRRARRDTATASKAVAVVVARRDSAPKPVVVAPVRRDSTPKPVVAAPVRRDSAAKPVVVAPVRRDSTPKPVVAAPVRRDSTPKPVVVAPVRRDSTPKPVVAAPVRRDSPPPRVVRRDTAPAPKPVAAAAAVRRDSAPPPKPVAAATRVDTAGAPRASAGRFGVQFAAYNDKPGAEQYASILRTRGITARVEGVVAPFRVRAGRFTTRAEAEASAALWRRPGTAAIIVALGPTP